MGFEKTWHLENGIIRKQVKAIVFENNMHSQLEWLTDRMLWSNCVETKELFAESLDIRGLQKAVIFERYIHFQMEWITVTMAET